MAKTIFYSLAALVRKILFCQIHIFAPPCNILYFLLLRSMSTTGWSTMPHVILSIGFPHRLNSNSTFSSTVFCFTEQNSNSVSFSKSQCCRLLKLLLTGFSKEVDDVRRSCRSQVSSYYTCFNFTVVLFLFLSSPWWSVYRYFCVVFHHDVRMKFFRWAFFRDNLQACLRTVCCSMLSWESGCNFVASIESNSR